MKTNWFWATLTIGISIWGLIGCGRVTVDNDVDAEIMLSDSQITSMGGTTGGTNADVGNTSTGGHQNMGMGGEQNTSGQGGNTGTGGRENGNDSGLYPLNHLCDSPMVCSSGNCSQGVCANPLKINGDGCTGNTQCMSNWCNPVLGVCQNMPVLRGPGESCAYDWECSGFCNDMTIPNTCHLTYSSGYGPCTRNTQCGSGACDFTRRLCN